MWKKTWLFWDPLNSNQMLLKTFLHGHIPFHSSRKLFYSTLNLAYVENTDSRAAGIVWPERCLTCMESKWIWSLAPRMVPQHQLSAEPGDRLECNWVCAFSLPGAITYRQVPSLERKRTFLNVLFPTHATKNPSGMGQSIWQREFTYHMICIQDRKNAGEIAWR